MSDLHAALVSGQPNEALSAIRAVLAGALLDVDPKDKPQVAKQLVAVIDAQQRVTVPDVSASDDLAKQREARRSAATSAASA